MKKLLFISLLLLRCITLYAADTEVQDLVDITAPALGDDMYIVDDPDGTPASKKINIGALLGVANDLDINGDVIDHSHNHTTSTISGLVIVNDLETFSSADLANRVTDETGTGLAVFSDSPSFSTAITVPNNTISAAELDEGDTFTWTGVHDAGGATSFEIPNAAAPVVNTTGEVAVDTNVITQGQMLVYGAAAINYVTATTDTPADNESPKYDAGTGTITWEADVTGSGGGAGTDDLADVVARGNIADGNILASGIIVTSGDSTATGIVADFQFMEYSGGGAVTFRDSIDIVGNAAMNTGSVNGNFDIAGTLDMNASTIDNVEVLNLTAGGISNNSILLTTDTAGSYAAGDAEAGAATSGDTATAFFAAGTIEHERGGLEADVNAYSGLVAISGTATSEVDAKSELEAQIADVADFAEADGDTYTGVHDAGGATSFEIPNTAGDVTVNAAGEIAIDSSERQLVWYDGTEEISIPAIHIAQGTFDMASQWDLDPDLWLIDLHTDRYVSGIVIKSVYLDCSVADPVTELDANFNECDAVGGAAFPGANPIRIDALDTTTGNYSNATLNWPTPVGKSLYITLDADPTDANTVWHFRAHFTIQE